jgi:hypothetical protein
MLIRMICILCLVSGAAIGAGGDKAELRKVKNIVQSVKPIRGMAKPKRANLELALKRSKKPNKGDGKGGGLAGAAAEMISGAKGDKLNDNATDARKSLKPMPEERMKEGS